MREGRAMSVHGASNALIQAEALKEFAADVQYYLTQSPRQLPSRYLYDTLGSALFDAICRLPWYRITRAEARLLVAHGRHVFDRLERVSTIVELGSGDGEKLRTLVQCGAPHVRPLTIHLVDVSSSALTSSERTLSELDDAAIVLHQATYEAGLEELALQPRTPGRRLAVFLGSNIGNFDAPGADEFLRAIRRALLPGDGLLLGADLVKPEPVLHLAYDDPLGVTAAFNRNLLVRINRELGGDFDLDRFEHRAIWNAADSRVEMHLVAKRAQRVRIPAAELDVPFAAGEWIWTESSYKYEPGQVVAMLESAGFQLAAQWIDAADRFALTLVLAN
jgi:dimethylhistidine N-methyltransferase